MKQPRYWRQMERHPLSAEYGDIDGPHWEEYLAGVREFGIIGKRKIVTLDGKILDGWQLQRACVEADVKPIYEELKLPKGMTVEQWVEVANDHRRHESMEVLMERANKRRKRVAAARIEGKSIRVIAEQEGVSKTTVENDLETITVQGGQCEPKGGKIIGKDEREQPATKHPSRWTNLSNDKQKLVKSGKVSVGEANALYDERTAGFDRMAKRNLLVTPDPAPRSDFHVKAQRITDEVREIHEQLQSATEQSDSVLRNSLEKQRKKLELVMADIDLALGKEPPSNGRLKFIQPTVEQVEAYSKEIGAGIDAARFVDYYSSNGWKVGKSKMVDWKAAVRNWKHNRKGFGNGRISRVEAPAGKYDGIGITVGKAGSS